MEVGRAYRKKDRWPMVHGTTTLGTRGGKRRVGHPKARWRDDLDNFVKQYMDGQTFDWYLIAQDRDSWASLEDEYACGVQRGR